MECGRPKTGTVADIMRKTRASYHYAIRTARRNEKDIVKNNFADAVLSNNRRDFWNEVKRMKHAATSCSSVVDSLTNPEDIADKFASKYQDLYTSVSFNVEDINEIRRDVNSAIQSTGFDCNCMFTCSDVGVAVRKLKPGKK